MSHGNVARQLDLWDFNSSSISATPNKKHFQWVLRFAFQFFLFVTKTGSNHSKLMFKDQTQMKKKNAALLLTYFGKSAVKHRNASLRAAGQWHTANVATCT